MYLPSDGSISAKIFLSLLELFSNLLLTFIVGHIVLDLCAFNTKAPLDYVYLKDLTSEQCEANWRKIEEPEPRRYVLPLTIPQDVSNVTGTPRWKINRPKIKQSLYNFHILFNRQDGYPVYKCMTFLLFYNFVFLSS